MATVDKTWAFATDNEGLVDSGNSAFITAAYDPTDGTPSTGCMGFTSTRKNMSNVVEWAIKAATTDTWETWGVPSGATVTQVQCTAWYEKLASATGITGNSFIIRVVNASGNTVHSAGDLISASPGTSADASWQTGSSGTARAVDASYQASTTSVRLMLRQTFSSGAGTVSIDQRYDNITIQITYTPATQNLAPTVVGTTAGLVDPTMSPGAATMTPTVVGTTAGTVDPTIGFLPQSLAPTVVEASSGTVDFSVGMSMTPTTVGVTSGSEDATLSPGSVSLTPTAVESVSEALGATLSPGAVTITPTPAEVASGDVACELSPGAVVIEPTAVGAEGGVEWGSISSVSGLELIPDPAEVASGASEDFIGRYFPDELTGLIDICTLTRVDHLNGNTGINWHEIAPIVKDEANDRVWICYSNLKTGASTYRGGVYMRYYDYLLDQLGPVQSISVDNTGSGRTNGAVRADNRWPQLVRLLDGTFICLYSVTFSATTGFFCRESLAPHDGSSWTAEVDVTNPISSPANSTNHRLLGCYTDGTDVFLLVQIIADSAANPSLFPNYGRGDIFLLRRTGTNTWAWTRIIDNINDQSTGASDYSQNPAQQFFFKNNGDGSWKMAFVGMFASSSSRTNWKFVPNQQIGSQTTWSVNGSGITYSSIFTAIDEITPSYTDWIANDAGESGSVEIKFGSQVAGFGTPINPIDYTNITFRFSALKELAGQGAIDYSIKQGVRSLQSGTVNITNTIVDGTGPDYVEYTVTLSETNARAISDFTDLRMTFAAGGAVNQRVRIAWAYFTIPAYQTVFSWSNANHTTANESGNETNRWTRSIIHDFTSDTAIRSRQPMIEAGTDGVLRVIYLGIPSGSTEKLYGAVSTNYGLTWTDLGLLDSATVNFSKWDSNYDRSMSLDSDDRWIVSTCGDTAFTIGMKRHSVYRTNLTDGNGWTLVYQCDYFPLDPAYDGFSSDGPGGSTWVGNHHIRLFGTLGDVTHTSNKLVLLNTSVPVIPDLTCLGTDTVVCEKVTVNICAEIDTPGHSYLWSGPNGFSSTDRCISVYSASPTSAIFRVRITDTTYLIWVECDHSVTWIPCKPPPPPPVTIPEYPLANRIFRRGVIKTQRAEIPQPGAYTVSEIERLDQPNWEGS